MNTKAQRVTKSISSSIENNQECGRNKTQRELWMSLSAVHSNRGKQRKSPKGRNLPMETCVHGEVLIKFKHASSYSIHGL